MLFSVEKIIAVLAAASAPCWLVERCALHSASTGRRMIVQHFFDAGKPDQNPAINLRSRKFLGPDHARDRLLAHRQHPATGRIVTAKPLLLASMLRGVSVEEVVEFAAACERQLLAQAV